jgi:hypothetical protein
MKQLRKTIKILLLVFLTTNSFHGYAQESLYATISGGDLFKFDLENCTREFIGATGIGFGDIAFTPNGRLWGIVSGRLYEIDPLTADTTLIGTHGLPSVSLVDLNDTTLLAEANLKLYGINTNDASSFLIDSIGFPASGDLTWYDSELYIVTAGFQIVRIELNDENDSILSVTSIGTDLPTCEGAATSAFENDLNSIIGFNGSDVIKICHLDGSFEVLCPMLNFGGTPGAASIRLENQNPTPASCVLSTLSQSEKPSIKIFPNPAINYIKITTSLPCRFEYGIFDSLGKVVIKGEYSSDELISLESIASGFYIIQLNCEDVIQRIRFVKKE